MLFATLKVTGPAAQAAVPSISPETGRELPRTTAEITMDGDTAVVNITAADASAMRAALNSYLECIRIIEDVEKLTR